MTTDVAGARAEIDRAVEGKTVLDWFERNATEFADKPALGWKTDEGWQTDTWGGYTTRYREIAAGLISLGVAHNDRVAIQTRNVPEHVIADAAALHAGATSVSIYNTLAPEQIAYVANDCAAKVAILENREFAKRWEEIHSQLGSLEHIVLLDDSDDFRHLGTVLSWGELATRGRELLARDPEAVATAAAKVRPDDPATIVYTSGTTGPPKGTIITHRNVAWTMESVFRHFKVPMHLSAISYLPLAHVAERATSYAASVRQASVTYFCPEMTEAIEVVKEARPYIFLAVPRVWEKVRAGVQRGLAEEPSPVRRQIALRAIDIGIRAVRARGTPLGIPLEFARKLFDRIVYATIRQKIGLDQSRILLTGAAPCSESVMEFFHAIGLPILDTWGMTELTVVAAINPPDRPKIGTVGVPLPGVEIAIADDGEILCRGGLVTAGYLNRPEESAATFRDGWVHSGDLGAFDDDGYLRIVGRKKEIIITAGGKNIAPNNIEALLKEHALVGNVCVVGDAKPYLAALIVLDPDTAFAWAKEHGTDAPDLATLATHPDVRTEVERGVAAANQRLARVESIKRFAILPADWTPESGDLTPSLKLKRDVIAERYAADIEALYTS